MRHHILFFAVICAAIPAAAMAAQADFPNRPIRMVIPFAPGGATDIIARVLEPRLGKRLPWPALGRRCCWPALETMR